MYDIIIVGGGPAGMTAALYALRGNKKVLIIEKTGFGGKISDSNEVENYPAIKTISGKEFSDNLYEQIKSLNVDYTFETVKNMEKEGKSFIVNTSKKSYYSKSVILSTGTKSKELGLNEEKGYVGAGVFYCALCDGNFFKEKTVAIVGGGNTALHDAVYLSDLCKKLYLIYIEDKPSGEENLIERVKGFKNVEFISNSTVTAIKGNGRVEKIEIFNTKTGEKNIVDVDGVLVAVGSQPQNESFENLIELDKSGYIITDEECKTSIDGIFAAGDCRKKSLRQLTTAVSDGTFAAVNAMNYIDSTF